MSTGLRIHGWDTNPGEHVLTDPYVPLKITWGHWDPWVETYSYWRTGDLKRSMLEFRLANETGIVRGVTLVMTDQAVIVPRSSVSMNHATSSSVIPVVAMDMLTGDRYVDCPKNLEVHVTDESVDVVWSDERPITFTTSGERVIFGLDSEDQLVLIRVVSLSRKEMAEIREALHLE